MIDEKDLKRNEVKTRRFAFRHKETYFECVRVTHRETGRFVDISGKNVQGDCLEILAFDYLAEIVKDPKAFFSCCTFEEGIEDMECDFINIWSDIETPKVENK